uniref:Hexosyltransferase n=1 Tax=Esox lucius TaxID=8010 RepID=A0AAY5L028_ESOLU
MWWNGSFVPWMCIPQISINCKMLSYQYGPTFLKNAFSTLLNQCQVELRLFISTVCGTLDKRNYTIYQYFLVSLFPQFKGQANLHVFEDWCGSSVAQLRKNLHFPLYPHMRTTVKKLAVAPKWKNYGLRIFGFLHPYRDGDFQFSVSSDDNSEFWLSTDESPLNARLLVYVGQVRTAPHTNYSILHKQDDKGSDHVEVGWRPFLPGLKYEVIDSSYISLYTDESTLKMNSVDHIPQTQASHSRLPLADKRGHFSTEHGADMLKPDPRDTFYSTPLIEASRLENVLPACLYSPTYVVKDFPIARYQGLQFVYLSFVYPNDFTRLTHMERENKCFYRESPMYLEKGAELGGARGRRLVSAPQLWPRLTLRDGKAPLIDTHSNASISRQGTVQRAANRATVERLLDREKRRAGGRGGQGEIQAPPERESHAAPFPHHLQPPPPTIPPNSSENTLPMEKRLESSLETRVTSYLKTSEITESQQQPSDPDQEPSEPNPDVNRSNADPEPEEGGVSDYSYEAEEARPGWAEESINWQRTFSVNPMDFELLRSDWNDLRCNVSGNLQLAESEVVDVLAQYMEKLNERNGGIYTLLRIINVEKRRDSARGNRYLVELELMERGRNVVRLSEYIYLLLHRGRLGEDSLENTEFAPASAPAGSPSPGRTQATPAPLASTRPVMLQWRKDVMVHFVVPVKNQARWVQQFITDMGELHRQTKDDNFSIIIVDFESTDMDVEQALRDSAVYEYLRREGNFERSAGLQIGVDTIEDNHSIVFLCDLHIHFPLNILESIRKHCVEGRLAFAPIVMRLGCGSSPLEPDGYWEVNGFGLFGIYKSDFDKIGGMNTEEFKDRWGGEDWELLDRVLQNGLEVERLRLRNFFHYYHSKRGMWNAQNKKSPKAGG